MDARTFDRLTAAVARRPTRRAALRLLTGGLLGGLLPRHGAATARAAQIDVAGPPSADLKCAAQGLSACGGVCTNTLYDHNNCGVCGNSCPLGGYCQSGACAGAVCLSGLVDCGTGTCADLSADPNHCGACGNSCPLGGYCQGGVCTGLICLDGLTDCYGSCVDLSTDWSHCGGCEFGCFAGATCVNGACVD